EDVPGWLVGAASAAAPGQVHNALTVLARASTHRPALTKALDSLITDQPAQVAPVAVAVALEVENPAPLAHAVDKAIARAASGAGDLDLLTALADTIPQQTLLHRERAVRLGKALVTAYRALAETHPDAYLPILAGSLNNLSVWLGELG